VRERNIDEGSSKNVLASCVTEKRRNTGLRRENLSRDSSSKHALFHKRLRP